MILFLNFAPIEFMGGAEKLMLELAHVVNKKESARLVDVSPKIANIYGKLILKREFKSHIKDHNLNLLNNHTSLQYSNFIPLTKKWFETRKYFKEARIIYMRFELLEIAICLYFGGLSSLKKVIAGLHLTPYYESPRGIIDKIHNLIYGSFIYNYFLNVVQRVHVTNYRDKKLLEEKYNVKEIKILPVGINIIKSKNKTIRNYNKLLIGFVGELSTRKGGDTIIDIIKNSPDDFIFNIVGDGPLKKEFLKLHKKGKCNYHGYVSSEKLNEIYESLDVFLFPSRAEAFGIVMAEAMAYGAKVVNSKEVTLNLPTYAELTINKRESKDYLTALKRVFIEKQSNLLNRNKIKQFAKSNYSKNTIHTRFTREIIGL